MTWPLWLVRRRLLHWRYEIKRARSELNNAIKAGRQTSEERYAEDRLTVALGKVQTWKRRLPR